MACIMLGCSCSAYIGTPSSRGSLIGYSRGCLKCGHLLTEHRQLPALELRIRQDLVSAAHAGCKFLMPFEEVQNSSIFGPYDPIPLPFGESPNMDSGVQCVCKGFQIKNICDTLDMFHGVTMASAKEMLLLLNCNGCGHQLSHHHELSQDGHKQKHKQRSLHPVISMTLNNCLPLPLGNSKSVILVGPTKRYQVLSFVALERVENRASILICSKYAPVNQGRPISTSEAIQDMPLKAQPVRRSARLHKKEAPRSMEELSEDTELASASSHCEIEGGSQNCVSHMMDSNVGSQFTKSLQVMDCHRYTIPENNEFTDKGLANTGFESCLVALCGTDPLNADDVVLVAMTTTSGSVCICYLSLKSSDIRHYVWLSTSNYTGSMCFQELSQSSISDAYLCVGSISGCVSLWHVCLVELEPDKHLKLQCSCVDQDSSVTSPISACSFSYDGSKLAVGTVCGEIVLYLLKAKPSGELHLKQTQALCCCNAQVKCIAWTSDGNHLGVGGCDDCVQILALKTSILVMAESQISSCSLLKYFTPLEPIRLQHTHTLKGHSSFVSGILFSSKYTVSVGWDGQVLFWDISQSFTSEREMPEEVEPFCGFKLGPSSLCQFLPITLAAAGASELLFILLGQKCALSLAHYTINFFLQ